MECYYQFIDRDVVDPLLGLRWPKFGNEHLMSKSAARGLVQFAVDPEPNDEETRDILARRTLRWTMRRSSPQYHFLAEVVCASLGGAGPYVACHPFEMAVTSAVAVEACLTDKIPRPTLHAMLKINAVESLSECLGVSKADERTLLRGWRPESMARPIYPWQGDDAHLSTGDTALGVADTRRLIRLLLCAWEENWPVPRLTSDALRLRASKKRCAPRYRDFQLARDLHQGLRDWPVRRPSVFRRQE